MDMNLILCGMMGVGKSSVGERIASLTGRRWADTDKIITDRYGRISNIFETFGEAHFRALESEAVRDLAKEDGMVISTGGGLILFPENRTLLKRNGKIIFLRASLEVLLERVDRADRPLLEDADDLAGRLKELLTARTPVYEQAADYIIETDGKTIGDVAEEVISITEGGLS